MDAVTGSIQGGVTMHKPPPCEKTCPGRSDICHSVCEKYLTWCDRRKKIKSRIDKKKALERIIEKGN